MKTFLVMPNGGKWYEVQRDTDNLQQVYDMEAHWFKPKTQLAIYDTETKVMKIFTRALDPAGNKLKTIQH